MTKWLEIPRRERECVYLKITRTLQSLEDIRHTALDVKMLEAAQELTGEIDAWYAALHVLTTAEKQAQTEAAP